MDLLFNDLSIHGQFPDAAAFEVAISRVMAIRDEVRRQGWDLQCHRNVANARVTRDSHMRQAVQRLSHAQCRALMQWLDRRGPFWEDYRQHDSDDYLECQGEVVTDTAAGEAAIRLDHGSECCLVSMDPSSWCFTPLVVEWRTRKLAKTIDVPNYWDVRPLRTALEAAPSLASWRDLETTARRRCADLTFSSDCFDPLEAYPFGVGAAHAILARLSILQDLKNSYDAHGQRTAAGEDILRKHFAGTKAWFSDSSATEKARFGPRLTFPHPTVAGKTLSCPWHAKVKTPQLRIHFSWPVHVSKPLYVVYIGSKIIRR